MRKQVEQVSITLWADFVPAQQTNKKKGERLTRMEGAGYGGTRSGHGGTGSGCGVVGTAANSRATSVVGACPWLWPSHRVVAALGGSLAWTPCCRSTTPRAAALGAASPGRHAAAQGACPSHHRRGKGGRGRRLANMSPRRKRAREGEEGEAQAGAAAAACCGRSDRLSHRLVRRRREHGKSREGERENEEERGGGEKLDREAEVVIYICFSRFEKEAREAGESGRS